MLRQPALLEHILQRPLAPAPARLGRIGQRIAQPLCFAPDLFLAFAHRLDQASQLAKGIDPLLLQSFDLLLVFREAFAHGLEQSLDLGFAGFLRLLEAFIRALEEFLLTTAEDFAPQRLELREHFLARFLHLRHLLVKIGGVGLERGKLNLRFTQFLDRGFEFGFARSRSNFSLGKLRLCIRNRARTHKPPCPRTNCEAEDKRDDTEKCGVHRASLCGT